MHLRAPHAAQMAIGISLSVAAIGIPLAWNWSVSRRIEARSARPVDSATALAERAAIEILVNDRRLARGAVPIDVDVREARLR